jgi:hypothetical protein
VENADDNPLRRKRRYDHVTILLWVMIAEGAEWKRIRAQDWNEIGFNFYFDQEISSQELLRFKKESLEFSGRVVWTLKNDCESAILETIVNEALKRELKRFRENKDLIERILSMVHTSGLLEKKKKLLAHFGHRLAPEDEQQLIKDHRSRYRRFRYGVQVTSDAWTRIVQKVLCLTAVVDNIDDLDHVLSRLRTKP